MGDKDALASSADGPAKRPLATAKVRRIVAEAHIHPHGGRNTVPANLSLKGDRSLNDENKSIVQIPRDYSDIAKLQDPGVLEDFLAEPPTFIAEVVTGAIADGKKSLALVGGRIVQALFKGQLFSQFGKEFKRAREAGRLKDDFAERKFGLQSWVEMMTVIDEETPDPERLEALKAMFFAVNRPNITDQEQITQYQLWKITKGLNSGELHLLKTAYENRSTMSFNSNYLEWTKQMAVRTGFHALGLVELHGESLARNYLFSPVINSGTAINPINGMSRSSGSERDCFP
jgi:hypothetical protein